MSWRQFCSSDDQIGRRSNFFQFNMNKKLNIEISTKLMMVIIKMVSDYTFWRAIRQSVVIRFFFRRRNVDDFGSLIIAHRLPFTKLEPRLFDHHNNRVQVSNYCCLFLGLVFAFMFGWPRRMKQSTSTKNIPSRRTKIITEEWWWWSCFGNVIYVITRKKERE
jgi:hypothetical protein